MTHLFRQINHNFHQFHFFMRNEKILPTPFCNALIFFTYIFVRISRFEHGVILKRFQTTAIFSEAYLQVMVSYTINKTHK